MQGARVSVSMTLTLFAAKYASLSTRRLSPVAVGYHKASYIIGSDNGLVPIRQQAIVWTNDTWNIADLQLWDPGTFQ